MADPARELESKALKLPAKERARLAERLISSLDQETDPDAEKLWLQEAESRLDELESGRVLRYALEMEGHADNVSAAYHGGWVVSCPKADGSVLVVKRPWPMNLNDLSSTGIVLPRLTPLMIPRQISSPPRVTMKAGTFA